MAESQIRPRDLYSPRDLYNSAYRAEPMSVEWYEVWADESAEIPYVLVLCLRGEAAEVLDPGAGNTVVFSGKTYEEAKMWLLEDEYVLVGRKERDE